MSDYKILINNINYTIKKLTDSRFYIVRDSVNIEIMGFLSLDGKTTYLKDFNLQEVLDKDIYFPIKTELLNTSFVSNKYLLVEGDKFRKFLDYPITSIEEFNPYDVNSLISQIDSTNLKYFVHDNRTKYLAIRENILWRLTDNNIDYYVLFVIPKNLFNGVIHINSITDLIPAIDRLELVDFEDSWLVLSKDKNLKINSLDELKDYLDKGIIFKTSKIIKIEEAKNA